MTKQTAAIIGLGQVAWGFDEDPGRATIWTHLGAYRATGRFGALVAYDVDLGARQRFTKRHPDVETVASIEAFSARRPQVVSICTPNATHRAVLETVFAGGAPRAVWCEKPLATNLRDATWMVEACRHAGVPLWVSHVRRWSPIWQRFRQRIAAGDVGPLRSLRIAMPNRLWSIGSHAVDLLSWLGGPVAAAQVLDVAALAEGGEPARAALFAFTSGAYGVLQVTGRKEKLLVTGEAIGDRGRLLVDELRGTLAFEPFVASARFRGYEELATATGEQAVDGVSPFVAIADEIARCLAGEELVPTCSGDDALTTQRLLAMLDEETTDPMTEAVA